MNRNLENLCDILMFMTLGRSCRVRRLGRRGPTNRLRQGFGQGRSSLREPAREILDARGAAQGLGKLNVIEAADRWRFGEASAR
jgi:hypothetical protein